MRTSVKLIAVAAIATGYASLVRPRLNRWGATEAELRYPYPGEGIVPGGRRGATMATTIAAPPSAVWPWLVQMGLDRGGWYSWDHLDNGGTPSADRIHGEWQQLEVGDRLASRPNGKGWFEVAALEPERFLGLRACFDLRGRPYDPDGPRPRHYTDSLWCFELTEWPGRRTRLVVSGYADARPYGLQRALALLVWEPTHWIMQTRQFATLRRLAEAFASAAEASRGDERTAAQAPAESSAPRLVGEQMRTTVVN